ncbi:MAG: hypothetical protein AABZ36_07810, partial [Nitrospirota bacterium]
VNEKSSVAELEISKDMIFVNGHGRLDEVSYPEIISQAIAAQNGFRHAGNGGFNSQGLLLGVKNLEILGSTSIGDRLRVVVNKVAKYSEFGVIKGEIFNGADLIARGEVTIWHSEA